MRYVAAYLLAALSGKNEPTAADIEKILSSVAIEADKTNLDLVIKLLKGKNIQELIAEGAKKMATMPSAPAASAGAAPAAGAPADKKSAKEEKPAAKEEEQESDDDMGFGLFD